VTPTVTATPTDTPPVISPTPTPTATEPSALFYANGTAWNEETGGSILDILNQGSGGASYDLDVEVGTANNMYKAPPRSVTMSGGDGILNQVGGPAGISTIEFRFEGRVKLSDHDPVSFIDMANQWSSGGQAFSTFLMRMHTGGIIGIVGLNGSTSFRNYSATVSLSSVGITEEDAFWWKFEYNNDPEQNWYYSLDDTNDPTEVSWTKLGATLTVATANNIANNSAPFGLGAGTTEGSTVSWMHFAGYADWTTTTQEFVFDGRDLFGEAEATLTNNDITYDVDATDAVYNTSDYHALVSKGSSGFETTTGQTITAPLSIMIAIKPLDASPGADQYVFDAKETGGESVSIFTDNANSDKWTVSAGGTEQVLSDTYDNDWEIVYLIHEGDATTEFGIYNEASSVTADTGSNDWDFATFLSDISGTNAMGECLVGEIKVWDFALSGAQLTFEGDKMEAKFSEPAVSPTVTPTLTATPTVTPTVTVTVTPTIP
jgi:hypothetical protein